MGNGPSLRGFDFARLAQVDTIGMNAAYRYWHTIDWRPTHYVCLDDALIDTHHSEIRNLIEEARVESFFLSGQMLNHHPDLARRKGIRFLDEFIRHWHVVRGKAFGLKFHPHPVFRTKAQNLITTGAYAVRYAAMLGYRQIGLLGIDLNYIEPEFAENLEGDRLRITETPGSNPNYFFDGYQQAGDLFHIPNPASHNGELHVEAFRTLRDDFVENDLPATLLNLNPDSRLASEGILPFEDVETLLGGSEARPADPHLGAVVLHVESGGSGQILETLAIMAQPGSFPWLGDKPVQLPALAFVLSGDRAAEAERAIRKTLSRYGHLRACFGELRFISANGQPSEAGANALFEATEKAVADLPGQALVLDADSVPFRPDWLGKANRLLASAPEYQNPASMNRKPWLDALTADRSDLAQEPLIVTLEGAEADRAKFAETVQNTIRTMPNCHLIRSRQLAEIFRKLIRETGTADICGALDDLKDQRGGIAGSIVSTSPKRESAVNGRIRDLTANMKRIVKMVRSRGK